MGGNLKIVRAQRGRASGRLPELALKHGGRQAEPEEKGRCRQELPAVLGSEWYRKIRTRAGVGSWCHKGKDLVC